MSSYHLVIMIGEKMNIFSTSQIEIADSNKAVGAVLVRYLTFSDYGDPWWHDVHITEGSVAVYIEQIGKIISLKAPIQGSLKAGLEPG